MFHLYWLWLNHKWVIYILDENKYTQGYKGQDYKCLPYNGSPTTIIFMMLIPSGNRMLSFTCSVYDILHMHLRFLRIPIAHPFSVKCFCWPLFVSCRFGNLLAVLLQFTVSYYLFSISIFSRTRVAHLRPILMVVLSNVQTSCSYFYFIGGLGNPF